MSAQWKSISPDEASQHPLYGVKGWLAVFAVGTLLGVLKEVGGLNGEAYKAGLTLGQLFDLDSPLVKFIKFVLAIEVASVSVIYWLLLTKHRQFRPVSTGIILCTYLKRQAKPIGLPHVSRHDRKLDRLDCPSQAGSVHCA